MTDSVAEATKNPFISPPSAVPEIPPKPAESAKLFSTAGQNDSVAKVEMNGDTDPTALNAFLDSFDPFATCKSSTTKLFTLFIAWF